jgi:hypothetical protein
MSFSATTKSNNPAYDASADWYNWVTNAINNLLHCAAVEVQIQANTDHADFMHPLEVKPAFAFPVPIGRTGELWVDPASLTESGGTVYCANPPLEGTYTVMVLLYY